MLDLYQFPSYFDLPNLSPFCMKVEGFLRIANIPYQTIMSADLQQAPKGKLPFIRDNGIAIADSELIIDYLESKFEFQVDGHLSSVQKANHHAYSRMLEEHLYWALIYSRYEQEENWRTLKEAMFGHVPPPLSNIRAAKVRHRMREQLTQHGIGRHHHEEVYRKAAKDIDSLAQLLGDRVWFGGDYVSKLDLSALAILANILLEALPSALQKQVKKHENLVQYTENALQVIFPKEAAE